MIALTIRFCLILAVILFHFSLFESSRPLHPRNCQDIKKKNVSTINGTYTIFPKSCQPEIGVDVLCDMDTLGGGWTILQRRHDVQTHVDFNRNWTDYKKGFGLLDTEYWIGLDNIHDLTSQGDTSLLIMLTDISNQRRNATYSSFIVRDETYNYKMNVHGFSGNAGNGMISHNGMNFSTYDRDLDMWTGGNCAKDYKGGWWFVNCFGSNLNGFYHVGSIDTTPYDYGVYWGSFSPSFSLKRVAMMIRLND